MWVGGVLTLEVLKEVCNGLAFVFQEEGLVVVLAALSAARATNAAHGEDQGEDAVEEEKAGVGGGNERGVQREGSDDGMWMVGGAGEGCGRGKR